MTVVALKNLRETGDDFREELTPNERDAKILERELPHLINDVAMLIGRPFRFVWDPRVETACTDCLAEVRVAPRPFIRGEREVGYGTVYHESGHILFSPYGGELMAKADRRGGTTLRNLVNIIVDRKDDMLVAGHAPGFADTLRRRLLSICTLARRQRYAQALAHMSAEDQARFLRNAKPQDTYEDFFLAAKWHKRPRFAATHKAMKYLSSRRLRKASSDELLWIAERVRALLGVEAGRKEEREKTETSFNRLYAAAVGIECGTEGGDVDPNLSRALRTVITRYLASLRKSGKARLIEQLKTANLVYPGPLSVGLENEVPLKVVPPHARFQREYEALLAPVEPLVKTLVEKIRKIDNPSEIELYGRDEGELDLTEAARIAAGLSGYYMETVTERDIDAEIHLAIDDSGSMEGEKARLAKQIATVFSEAIRTLDPQCAGRIWGFNSGSVRDYGPLDRSSAFVRIEGTAGNADTHMLSYVGKALGSSRKRRKVLLVLCDDGPDDMKLAGKLAKQLMARGIIVVHLLVGVHGTPDIYPVELLYTSMEECLNEFGELLEAIISNLR